MRRPSVMTRCSVELKAVFSGAIFLLTAVQAEDIVFPANTFVKNVKTAFGAKGDGTTDDTGPLNTAFKTLTGIIYLPNGTYRVTSSILGPGGATCGPWIYGQSRDGVVIKLDDNATGFADSSNAKPVIAGATSAGSADQFMRQWHNFTVDAGNNRGAIGVRYYSNNSGTLHNVRIVGNGKYGIDMGWLGMNGPLYIQDVTIEGFAFGVYTVGGLNSQTMSNITIRNCGRYGIYCNGQNLSIEDLTIENVPTAIFSRSMLMIINGTFTGNDATKPAILNECCHLYARNITTTGFSRAIQSTNGGVAGATVTEFTSEAVVGGFTGFRRSSLNLPIRKSPPTNWESDTAQWLCVNDYGATSGGRDDDALAFQVAIDAAAAAGKTTVCIQAGDYTMASNVTVHGSVRHIIGLGLAHPTTPVTAPKGFILGDDAAPVVRFENIYTFAPSILGALRTVATNNTSALVIDNCDGWTINASGSGDVFINNTAALVAITNPLAHVWARQWNTEGHGGGADSDNKGGFLWILGLKTESGDLKISTTAGGMTELLGAHIYNICDMTKTAPLFDVVDSWASFAIFRETTYCTPYATHVRETRNGVAKTYVDNADKAVALYSAADSSFVPPQLSGVKQPAPRTLRMKSNSQVIQRRILDRGHVSGSEIYDCRGLRVRPVESREMRASAGVYIVKSAR